MPGDATAPEGSPWSKTTGHTAQSSAGVIECELEQLGELTCRMAEEVHRARLDQDALREAVESLVEMYKTVHPDAALVLARDCAVREELTDCCPEKKQHPWCHWHPCGHDLRDRPEEGITGWSRKSVGYVDAVRLVDQHPRWELTGRIPNQHDPLPGVALGRFAGDLTPANETPQVRDFRSGGTPVGGQQPVTFRTFTKTELAAGWPPDMSGARGGDVVVMSGNLWLKLSVDGGRTFTDLDWTTIFAADTTYGGWAGDQVIHYVPAIDAFVLYVQSFKNTTDKTGKTLGKNVVKVALASPADLITYKGGAPAWRRQWDFTSDTFGLGSRWLDFPDVTFGDGFLYVNQNVFTATALAGKLFFELPLADLQAGRGFSFRFAFINDSAHIVGSPTQNITDENYWAAHLDNATMRVYSSKGTDADFFWRDRTVLNWPRLDSGDVASAAPDYPDWISEDHRIIGATKVGNELWFAWTAASGDGGHGGFNFPNAHIQIAKFDVTKDYARTDQTQVWNPNNAFCYPCLTTNSDNEVGISLAWGGGGSYGSHAVGILGDFIVWFGDASTVTSERQQQDSTGAGVFNPDGTPALFSRFGDYLHVRLAQPDTRFFSAFGYAAIKGTSVGADTFDFLYVEFGREPTTRPGPRPPS